MIGDCDDISRDISKGWGISIRAKPRMKRAKIPGYNRECRIYTDCWKYTFVSAKFAEIFYNKPLPPVSGTSKHSRMRTNSSKKTT